MVGQTTRRPRNMRVFVSSTFRDMHAERDVLVRSVFPKLNDTLAARNLTIEPVDLRWGVTADDDSLGACLQLIEECEPFFLCLIGSRYGWIPEDGGISITAQEIEHASFGTDPRCSTSLFYFRDPAATEAVPEAHAGDYVDAAGGIGPQLLEQLKTDIEAAGFPIRVYPCDWIPAEGRFGNLEAFGHSIYDDLLDAIDALHPADTLPTPGSPEHERLIVDAFLDDRRREYQPDPHRATFRRLQDFCTGERDSTGGGCQLVLSGGPGSGKTSLLASLARELERDDGVTVLSYFPEGVRGTPDLGGAMATFMAALGVADADEFDDALRAASEQGPVVLIVDSVDLVETWDDHSQAERVLVNRLDAAGDLRVVFSVSEANIAEFERVSDFDVLVLPWLDVDDQGAVAQQYLARYRKKLDDAQLGLLLAKDHAERPGYLVTALDELRTLGDYDELTSRIAELPGETDELFHWIIRRLEEDPILGDDRREVVTGVLAGLACSRHGLTISELAALATVDASDDELRADIAAVLQLLRAHTRVIEGAYALRSPGLIAAVRERYLPDDADASAIHTRTADVLLDLDPVTGGAHRVRLEITHALRGAGRLRELHEFLLPFAESLQRESGEQAAASPSSIGLALQSDATTMIDVLNGLVAGTWHPKPAEFSGTTGAQWDYVDSYTYPCCGKGVLSERRHPPQITTTGCSRRPRRRAKAEAFAAVERQTFHDWIETSGAIEHILNSIRLRESRRSS